MIIQSATKIGHFHPVYCEDVVSFSEVAHGIWVAGVFDGCTMGKESHFASALAGKLLRKTALTLGWQLGPPGFELKEIAIQFLRDFRHNFRQAASDLMLEKEELLTTILIALVDTRNGNAFGFCAGDGLVIGGGEQIEFEQGNKPDYMAYHWGMEFEHWLKEHCKSFSFEGIGELVLSTDGIFAFEKLDPNRKSAKVDIVEFIIDQAERENPKGMLNQISILENDFGLYATDDLGIVRLNW